MNNHLFLNLSFFSSLYLRNHSQVLFIPNTTLKMSQDQGQLFSVIFPQLIVIFDFILLNPSAVFHVPNPPTYLKYVLFQIPFLPVFSHIFPVIPQSSLLATLSHCQFPGFQIVIPRGLLWLSSPLTPTPQMISASPRALNTIRY